MPPDLDNPPEAYEEENCLSEALLEVVLAGKIHTKSPPRVPSIQVDLQWQLVARVLMLPHHYAIRSMIYVYVTNVHAIFVIDTIA